MNWIILAWALTVSYVPDLADHIYDQRNVSGVDFYDCFAANLDVEARLWGHVRIYGSVETYMMYDSGFSFLPFRADYRAGAALYADGVELGVWHECDHGVNFTNRWYPWYGSDQTQVYLKISSGGW